VAKKKLERFIPTTFPLDGDLLNIRVRRFTEAELLEEKRLRENVVKGDDGAPVPDVETIKARALENAKRMVREYVVIESGELDDANDKPITTGAQLLNAMPGREDVTFGLMQLVFAENQLSEGQRQDFRRAVGSALGWPVWSGKPNGAEPAPTAESARPKDSSESAAAPLPETPHADGSSGATADSTFGAAPSEA
jgi:hypothetical protein